MRISRRPSVHRFRVGTDGNVAHLDAWLPPAQGFADEALGEAESIGVDRREDELVDAAAELRAHHALSQARAKDERDGFVDVIDARGKRQASAAVGTDGEGPATADDFVIEHGRQPGSLPYETRRSLSRGDDVSERGAQLILTIPPLISTIAPPSIFTPAEPLSVSCAPASTVMLESPFISTC